MLLKHYVMYDISVLKHYEKDADGLCTMLKKPLKKKTEMVLSTTLFKESFQKGNKF